MPVFDGKNITESEGIEPLPFGDYPSKIVKIQQKTTKDNDPMWNVKHEIINCEDAGRYVYDNWVWNDDNAGRIKLILHRYGFDTEVGAVDYKPDQFIGRAALLTVTSEEYNNKTRNKVTFDGYDYYDNGTNDTPKEEESDLPF